MVWIKSCLWQQEKIRPPISPPVHLLLKNEGVGGHGPCHIFKHALFKKSKPCNLCHQPILNKGSICRVCQYVCHRTCELKNYQDQSLRNGMFKRSMDSRADYNELSRKKPQEPRLLKDNNNNNTKITTTTTTTTTRTTTYYNHNGMDLSYVTERIIAIWFPGTISTTSYHEGHRKCCQLLRNKYGNKYMIFNLSEGRKVISQEHEHVKDVGWCSGLAPPLERICRICKDIDAWLSVDKSHIAVLHTRGDKDKLGLIVASFMHYSKICGSAEQALDRFSMQRFLDENIGHIHLPSNLRYIEYFCGLLSGNIRVNVAPIYLSHVTIFGSPVFENSLTDRIAGGSVGCRAFLKIYEGRKAIYTSGIYTMQDGSKQCTISVLDDDGHNLRLRGDILMKCYHRNQEFAKSGRDSRTGRECIFACQFHTCAINDSSCLFTRSDLDSAFVDPRFPIDASVQLHFSASKQNVCKTSRYCPDVILNDPVTNYDSFENIFDMDDEYFFAETDDVIHTYGPLDGSIYATIAKKSTLMPGTVSSPLTVSMDSGISSAGNIQNNIHTTTTTTSSLSPQSSPLTPEDQHRELDELLSDMLLNVENIPDFKVEKHDLNSMPYHAREDSKPFSYTPTLVSNHTEKRTEMQKELSSPYLMRKLSGRRSQKVPNGILIQPVNGSENGKKMQIMSNGDQKSDNLSKCNTECNSNNFSEEKCDKSSLSASTNEAKTPYLDYNCNYHHIKNNSHPQFHSNGNVKCNGNDGNGDGDGNSNSTLTNERNGGSCSFNGLSWLQKQQIKLKEKRDLLEKNEDQTKKIHLIKELKNIQQQKQSDFHRKSPVVQIKNDHGVINGVHDVVDKSFSMPLHINTSKNSSKSDKVQQNGYDKNCSSGMESNDSGLLSMVEEVQPKNQNSTIDETLSMVHNAKDIDHLSDLISSLSTNICFDQQSNHFKAHDENSSNSCHTQSISDQDVSSSNSSPRPQTPAFPTTLKSSTQNSHVHFQLPVHEKLPPKSPLTNRKDVSVFNSNLNYANHVNRSISPVPSNFSFSPKQSSSPIYLNQFFRDRSNSIHSINEKPHEVAAHLVKFVQDTSKFWYKPTISRDEAIRLLRNQAAGTFVVRDSSSFTGAFGLALKVTTVPQIAYQKHKQDYGSDELIRHFLIEPTTQGVRLKGCLNEPVFSSLSAFIYQHSVTQLALPQLLTVPEFDLESNISGNVHRSLISQGAACNVLYIYSIETESLTGPQAIRKSVLTILNLKPLPKAITVHFKVSAQGITLTDNHRQLFFRKHYPFSSISYSGMDPEDHRWHFNQNQDGIPSSSNHCFGFVAKKIASSTENECHIFADMEPEQPATAIVSFINKVLSVSKPNQI